MDVLSPDRMPLPGVHVIFASADGELLDDVVTDIDGAARADVPTGSSATVLRDLTANVLATTYLDLWEDAHIVTRFGRDMATRPVSATWTAPTAMTASYFIYPSCGGNPFNTTLLAPTFAVPSECSRFDVVVIARNAQTIPTHYAVRADLPETTTNVAIGADWHALGDALIDLENMVGGVTVDFSASPTLALPPTAPMAQVPVPPSGEVTSQLFPLSIPYTATIRSVYSVAGSEEAAQVHVEQRPANTQSFANDMGPVNFPWILDPILDATRRNVSWTIVSNGSTRRPSIVVAEVSFRRGSTNHQWHVIGRGDRVMSSGATGTLAIPVIPGTDIAPTASDTNPGVLVHYVGATPGTENAVRANLESHLEQLDMFGIPGLTALTRATAR